MGVLVPDLSDGYHTLVMSGIGDHLMRECYFYFGAHRYKQDVIEEYPRRILLQRLQGFKDYPQEFAVPPELSIRETTAPPNGRTRRRHVGT